MKKVILTKGLPASGKSTWATNLVLDVPNTYKRINKDLLREMLDCNHFSKANEEFIIKVRDSLIIEALNVGKHVIVDDTNLHSKHEQHIKELVKGNAVVEIKDFTHIPLQTCIERDLKRINSVGEKVIKDMYYQFIEPTKEKVVYDEDTTLPKAIIVDIDGTLAIRGDRSPFDWKRVGEDKINKVVKGIVDAYPNTVIIMSGRDSICRKETEEWLSNNHIWYNYLYMRHQGNTLKDSIVKRQLFNEHIKGKFYIEYVLDDRNQVVDMWRSMGLTCLQVAEGNF